MSVKVSNYSNIERLSNYQVFRTYQSNKDRNHSKVYESYLGNDGLNLSKDYIYEYNYGKLYKKNNKSYSNIVKFLIFMSIFLVLLLGFFATLIALGGLYFIILLLVLFLTVILMYIVNLNPLDKRTYKKLGIIN